jgi:hypothetical protein
MAEAVGLDSIELELVVNIVDNEVVEIELEVSRVLFELYKTKLSVIPG